VSPAQVACYEGQLVTLSSGGDEAMRRVPLPDGLRDVVVDGDRVFVSRFREAQLLSLDDGGAVLDRARPLPDERPNTFPAACSPSTADFVPAVAWRSVRDPDGGVMASATAVEATPTAAPPNSSAATWTTWSSTCAPCSPRASTPERLGYC